MLRVLLCILSLLVGYSTAGSACARLLSDGHEQNIFAEPLERQRLATLALLRATDPTILDIDVTTGPRNKGRLDFTYQALVRFRRQDGNFSCPKGTHFLFDAFSTGLSGRVDVLEHFRRVGLNKLLVLAALNAFPQTRMMGDTLYHTNRTLFLEALVTRPPQTGNAVADELLTMNSREARRRFRARLLDAFWQTPYARTARGLGFEQLSRLKLTIDPAGDLANIDVDVEYGAADPKETKVIVLEQLTEPWLERELRADGSYRKVN